MFEIFIPVEIKGYQKINNISEAFLGIIKNNFNALDLSSFESTFFKGILLKGDKLLEELIILCNGEFGKHYFVNFDYLANNIDFLGVKIVGENQIGNNIVNIMNDISDITKSLSSNNLLTNSKKEDIKFKIDSSFFALSGVVFLLYSLKKEAYNNMEELNKIEGKTEFEGQAMLLLETSKTKSIQLQASIDKLEQRVELFIGAIKKMII